MFRIQRLYWKIFLYFWSAMVLAITVIGWFSAQFTQESYLPIEQQSLISNYGVTAVITYRLGGVTALDQWFSELSRQSNIRGYLFDSDGNELSGNQLSTKLERIQAAIKDRKLPTHVWRKGEVFGSPVIRSNDGKEFRFVAIKSFGIKPLPKVTFSEFIFGLLFAAIIAGLVCYFLSLYLTRPLRILENATRKLAKGDLNIRVRSQLGKRQDEIAQLGSEFDNMAADLQAMIITQQRLLHDVSHELRSPLTRLQMALALASQKLEKSVTPELNRIEKEAQRLEQLINQILSLARLEGKNYEIKSVEINLNNLLSEIQKDIIYEDYSYKDRIIINLSSSITLYVDYELIRSALENVIRNALKYSSDKKPIKLTAKFSPVAGIKLTLLDYGQGVPEASLKNLFKPFYRIQENKNGYGLGLAIAERAIHLHEGSIYAENAKEGGLKITIILPPEKVIKHAEQITDNVKINL